MRAGLDAVLARFGAHRRLAEYRRLADEATSSYLAERDRADRGAHASAMPKDDDLSPSASRLPMRRRLILILASAMVSLAVVELTAASTGVSEFNQGARSRVPPALTNLTEAAVVSPSAASDAAGGASGRAPTAPPPITAAPTRTAPGASPVTTGTAPGTIPVATGSAPSAGATTVSASPGLLHLLDLCRSVVAAGNSWPSVLKGADRATVIAAAGKKNNVLAYCTNLLATTG